MADSKPKAARTKIVATVGPACRDRDRLADLVRAGADVFRLNMAHGSTDEHESAIEALRSVSLELDRTTAILVDLAGPKIRLGVLPSGAVECVAGERLRFVRGEMSEKPQDLVTNYPKLVDELDAGDRILLADATVELIVEVSTADYAECSVVQPGIIRNRQGVNLPGVQLSVSALGEKDRAAARWAAAKNVDFVSLSFVRRAAEIVELKGLLREQKSTAHVIAKIEKPEALNNLDEIIEATDGVMVARGDLGAEIDIAEVPLAQKRIIAACNLRHRPVIVATQMLASMERSRYPTRAEVTDVANAVLDGADACMLSGETAIGKYPRQAVAMMNHVAEITEQQFHPSVAIARSDDEFTGVHEITRAIVFGAARTARQLNAKLLVVATRSGATALALSKQRLYTPVLALSDEETTLRQMCLYWGLTPERGAPVEKWSSLKEYTADWGIKNGFVEAGDYVVMVTGTAVTAGVHNTIEVYQV